MESINIEWNTVDLVRMADRKDDWHSMIADVTGPALQCQRILPPKHEIIWQKY